MAQPVPRRHIESNAERCGGKPCVAGTRIRVYDVYVWHEHEGRSADEIVSSFPELTLADVHAALAYYWDHRDEIDAQVREDGEYANRLKANHTSRLLRRITGTDATDADTISP